MLWLGGSEISVCMSMGIISGGYCWNICAGMCDFSSYYPCYGWINSVYYLHVDGDDCRGLTLVYYVLECEIPAGIVHVMV
jgi:hypothetical protein